jgi:hypothetical protein
MCGMQGNANPNEPSAVVEIMVAEGAIVAALIAPEAVAALERALSLTPKGLPPPGTKPPVANPEQCKVAPSTRGDGSSTWDPNGGEWRYAPEDQWHNPHWDYNPWKTGIRLGRTPRSMVCRRSSQDHRTTCSKFNTTRILSSGRRCSLPARLLMYVNYWKSFGNGVARNRPVAALASGGRSRCFRIGDHAPSKSGHRTLLVCAATFGDRDCVEVFRSLTRVAQSLADFKAAHERLVDSLSPENGRK